MKIKLLDSRIAGLVYGSPDAAACDLQACTLDPLNDPKAMDYTINLYPGHKVKIGAGFALALEPNTCALILPRSGLGSAGVVRIANQTGLIDPDFHQEIVMSIENQSNDVFQISPLDRIAQMLIIPFVRPAIEYVNDIEQNGRGSFGSTGV